MEPKTGLSNAARWLWLLSFAFNPALRAPPVELGGHGLAICKTLSTKKTFGTNGAEDGIRTRDLRFTKPLLYQLSYFGGRGP